MPAPATASTNQPAPVAAAAAAILDQCARFVQAMPEGVYTRESRTIKGGTIGKHVRHSVDHFAAALGCLGSDAVIDYDHREREVPMETSAAVALRTIADLRRRLTAINEPDVRSPVRISVMLAGDGTEATLHSSLGRELHFAFHHAVHHHAMMKAIAAEHGVDAPADFGLAPSTINYERSR